MSSRTTQNVNVAAATEEMLFAREPFLVSRCRSRPWAEPHVQVTLAAPARVPETTDAVRELAETLHDLAADLEDHADELRLQEDCAPPDELDEDAAHAYLTGIGAR